MTTPVERFRRARKDPALAVLEGFHPLKHALRFGAVVEEVATPDPAALAELARALGPDIAEQVTALAQAVPVTVFAALAPVPPATGVLAIARRPRVDAAAVLGAEGPGALVLLDRPRHLGNVGAVVRAAAAAGAGAVLTTGTLDPWHPAALRGAAGLHFALPVLRLDEVPYDSGRPLVAFDPAGEPLRSAHLPQGAILAFGTERGGLEAGLRARADFRLAIPMRPGVSSLNLATAVAVTLYMTGRAV